MKLTKDYINNHENQGKKIKIVKSRLPLSFEKCLHTIQESSWDKVKIDNEKEDIISLVRDEIFKDEKLFFIFDTIENKSKEKKKKGTFWKIPAFFWRFRCLFGRNTFRNIWN